MGMRASVVLALVLGVSSPGRAQVVELPTFPVGAAVFGDHLQGVDVAASPDGGFLVIWGDYTYGNNADDHATVRRFSPAATILGTFQADTSGHVFDPRIGPDGRGGFAASWLWIGNGEYLFFGQTLSAQGMPTGADFEVTLDLAGFPATPGPVVGTPAGPVFLWEENGFWARRLDADRSRRGGDIRVDEEMYKADVAVLADGGFVVTWWVPFGTPPSRGRLFDASGQPRGPVFEVASDFVVPRVAANPRGGFAVVGSGFDAATQASQVRARRFADDGTPLGPTFLVDPGATDFSVDPDPAFDDRGNLYVVWGAYREGEIRPPQARAFDCDGNPLGPAGAVGTTPAVEARVDRLASGSLVNVWYANGSASGSIVRICGGAACGDGVRVAACEECDAGAANGNAPDACRADCRRARCGDGVRDGAEGCDDGNTRGCDGCSPSCTPEAGVVCGDGTPSRACGEECDAGPGNNDVTPDACRTDCRQARCGDGALDGGEECDDGNGSPCDGCTFDCRTELASPPVCAPTPVAGVSAAEEARFADGLEEFLATENPVTGLGPAFNGRRCAECHHAPVAGGSSARTVTRIGAVSGGVFDPLEAHGGPLLQASGIVTASCAVAGEVVPPAATIVAERNAPPLFGLGLVEAIPDLSIRLAKDRQRAPLSGRFNVNRATNRIGRFGWKAQTATLHDFAADAYRDELGITSPFVPAEAPPQGVPAACDDAADPEDDGNDVAAFTDFMTLLSPLPTAERTREARRGRRYFRRLKCNGCHTDKYRTSRVFPVAALRGVRVPLFSDLLLHDMGPGLADGIVQEGATGSEFRTAPLWGVAASAPYLHDGRAATLAEAISAHGGEAQEARDRFLALDAEARAALVAYLESL
jgi:cysteine-rich repeat protein